MKMELSKKFHNYLEGEIKTSESKYVLEPKYLHLHENDISEQLHGYNLLEYLYRFIESIPELKSDLDSLVCCFSFEKESDTPPSSCKRDKFYHFKFTDFSWKSIEDFYQKYNHYKTRPKLISFVDATEGLVSLMKDSDLLQPYILIEKNISVEPIFSIAHKPNTKKINSLLNQYQTRNSYQSAWYGYKFKSDKAKYWTEKKEGVDQLHILSVGFIFHVAQWNYELKNAHKEAKTLKELEFSTLINISAHVFKTAITTDIISEIETIINDNNAKELEQLKENAQHLFVLTGIVNLLTKINDQDAFKETATKDKLLDENKADWEIKKRIEHYSERFYKRKGFKIVLSNAKHIPEPNIRVYDLFFSNHLVKSFFNTLLENIETHGFFEKVNKEEVCSIEINTKGKEWIFKNRAKKEFEVDSHKLTGNLLLYKSLIEKTDSGSMTIDCEKEAGKIFFVLTIKTK